MNEEDINNIFYKEAAEVTKIAVKNMIQYTSRGLGTNMFWMRINCKPEITLFHLKSNEKQKIEIN